MLNTKINATHVQDTSMATSRGNDIPHASPSFTIMYRGQCYRIRDLDTTFERLFEAVDSLHDYTRAIARIYSRILTCNEDLEQGCRYELSLLHNMLELVQRIEANMVPIPIGNQ